MPKKHKPRSGSLQYWPRKRARRIYPKLNLKNHNSKKNFFGFAGYKAGMITVVVTNQNPNTPAKKTKISYPVTVIECPPLKILGLAFYTKQKDHISLSSFLFSSKLDKNLSRKISVPKKQQSKKIPEKFDDVRAIVYTQPSKTGIGKKKPEIFEIGVSIKDPKELEKLLDSEIKISDLFEAGEYIDVKGVTKGKGFQGAVKRFGLSLKAKKSEKKKRSVGNLGAWTPTKVSWTVPQSGQMGFHTRADINKYIMKVGEKKDSINPKSGFKRYGLVKNDYILVKGSIPGPAKRLVLFAHSKRKPKTKDVYEVAT